MGFACPGHSLKHVKCPLTGRLLARAVGGRERTESAELFFVRLNVSRTIRKISPSLWVDNHAYVQGQSNDANFIVITGSFIIF